MPQPKSGESREDFVDRCMGDSEANADFPDRDQRFAFCNSKWENRDKADLASGDLEGGGKLQPQQRHRRCPPGMKWDRESQSCVPRRSEDCGCGWGYPCDLTLDDVRKELQAETARRQARDETSKFGLQPLENREVAGHPDDFLEDELQIAVALSDAALTSAEDVDEILDPVLSDPENFSQDEFSEATAKASRAWDGTFDLAEEAVVAGLIASLAKGEGRVSAGIIGDAPSRRAVLDGMRDIAQYNTNTFFNEQVLPSLQRKVLEVMEGRAPGAAPDLAAVRSVLDRRMKTVPYWRVVANSAASRSYHYGFLKAAQFQGFRGYQFVAILDDKTSQICRSINGKQWFIADAVNLMERAIVDPDPNAIKNSMPWVPAAQVEGLSSDALRDLGVMVPPLHGNCRSTIVPI